MTTTKTDAKLRREILVGRYLANPIVRGLFRVGVTPPMHTLIETRGRKSGLVRRVPVVYHRDGHDVWVISQHGRKSGWAANIGADPRVRVLHHREWLSGTAQLLPDDDVRADQDLLEPPTTAAGHRRHVHCARDETVHGAHHTGLKAVRG